MNTVPEREYVLVFIFRSLNNRRELLLGKRKKEGYAQNKLNGYGGKIEKGETPEIAAKREVYEECGIECVSLNNVGELLFEFPDRLRKCTVFTCYDFKNNAVESDEMTPFWFPIDSIPFNDMEQKDTPWIKQIIDGKNVSIRFIRDTKGNLVDVFGL